MHLGALGALFALSAFASCAYADERARVPDAAEAVQEGDVSQWIRYYQRERGAPRLPQPPGSDPQQRDRPASRDAQVPASGSDTIRR
jgi:hypothetical protein